MDWIGLAKSALNVILGLFGYSKAAPDPTIAAQKTGEELGAAKTQNADLQGGLHEIDTAQKARDRVDGDLAQHPDRVRAPDADAAPRGKDGIS